MISRPSLARAGAGGCDAGGALSSFLVLYLQQWRLSEEFFEIRLTYGLFCERCGGWVMTGSNVYLKKKVKINFQFFFNIK